MTDIYYFSGTGNSLSVAKAIARETKGRLIPLSSLAGKETVAPEADVVGLVFPVYYSRLPVVVKEFLLRLADIEGKYIFAVCTFGGAAGRSLSETKRLISRRGGRVSAGYGVPMPQNAFLKPKENRPRRYERSGEAAIRIAANVQKRKRGMFYDNLLIEFMMLCLHPIISHLCRQKFTALTGGMKAGFDELVRQSDRSFSANDRCKRCGVCEKVCPVGNICMTDNGPVWQHRCTHCLACYHWCPRQAIASGIAQQEYYYRHPEITALAIMAQRQKRPPESASRTV